MTVCHAYVVASCLTVFSRTRPRAALATPSPTLCYASIVPPQKTECCYGSRPRPRQVLRPTLQTRYDRKVVDCGLSPFKSRFAYAEQLKVPARRTFSAAAYCMALSLTVPTSDNSLGSGVSSKSCPPNDFTVRGCPVPLNRYPKAGRQELAQVWGQSRAYQSHRDRAPQICRVLPQ